MVVLRILNGKFTLTVKPGATLKISYIGYQTQEVKAARTMKIILKEDSELLQEVVVVGYGTQKKANLTGAVATVDVNKTLDSRPIADIGRGLQGAVAGVNITIPTGEVGSDPLIKNSWSGWLYFRKQYTTHLIGQRGNPKYPDGKS